MLKWRKTEILIPICQTLIGGTVLTPAVSSATSGEIKKQQKKQDGAPSCFFLSTNIALFAKIELFSRLHAAHIFEPDGIVPVAAGKAVPPDVKIIARLYIARYHSGRGRKIIGILAVIHNNVKSQIFHIRESIYVNFDALALAVGILKTKIIDRSSLGVHKFIYHITA